MTTSATRLNFRVRPDTEKRLRAAAAASDQSLTDFVITAAEVRADEVLATHTLVTADYYDQLYAAFDAPIKRNKALTDAAQQRRRFKQG